MAVLPEIIAENYKQLQNWTQIDEYSQLDDEITLETEFVMDYLLFKQTRRSEHVKCGEAQAWKVTVTRPWPGDMRPERR